MLNEIPNAKQITAPARLVRGCDEVFVATLRPVVRQEDVTLDLGEVERMDAAGFTALLALRAEAPASGKLLQMTGASRHAEEILKLVGLSGLLTSHDMKTDPQCGAGRIRPAA